MRRRLIHVTDAAGFTDAGGNPTLAAFEAAGAAEGDGDGDGGDNGPSAEIEWVHAEVHRWRSFSNVLRKRQTWKRRPVKLKGDVWVRQLARPRRRRLPPMPRARVGRGVAGGRQWAPTVDDVAAVALAAAHDEVELPPAGGALCGGAVADCDRAQQVRRPVGREEQGRPRAGRRTPTAR